MIQNTVLFLYTSSVESKKEFQKTVPFLTASRSIQKLEDLYSENYITVLKEIKTRVNGKIFFVYGLEDLVLLRWQYYAKLSTYSV